MSIRNSGLKQKISLVTTDKNEILRKRIELFYHQYQHEQDLYKLEKEKNEDAKLYSFLK